MSARKIEMCDFVIENVYTMKLFHCESLAMNINYVDILGWVHGILFLLFAFIYFDLFVCALLSRRGKILNGMKWKKMQINIGEICLKLTR